MKTDPGRMARVFRFLIYSPANRGSRLFSHPFARSWNPGAARDPTRK